MPTFPMTHDATWSDPTDAFHIHCVAHLTQQGQLWFQVSMSTNSWGLGFTGGVSAIVTAHDDTVIWASQLLVAGVYAKGVFWGPSSRTDTHFSEWIPAHKRADVACLEFLAGHDPHQRWAEDWTAIDDAIAVTGMAVDEVVNEAKRIMKDIKVI